MKAYSIKPHKVERQEIIIFGEDDMSVDDATRKAAKLSMYFRTGHPHTIQRITEMPEGQVSADFSNGHKAMDLEGLPIEEAIKKAEADDFVEGPVTHFERPLSYMHQ